ncbi:PucR family transcriptional regulator [Streptomyces caeruleatus]|uniref:PucR family transcriptional regulator n=1 Tax=Streptomyces caeruleatus TaxID=661399 RepID=A0A101TPL6_9ACTN|nr:helix-turn-helix domain-containing protein [Streptomyces caeruleatus]KUN96144.1 hypothetical protein AQJ67_33385 [Streptomyces caeruleatus]
MAWRRWVSACLAQTDDPALLTEVLDIASQSIFQFATDSVEALRLAGLEDHAATADAQALAAIELIVGGAPIAPELAEAQLGYRLARRHTALILWTATDRPGLDRAVEQIARSPIGHGLLVAAASVAARWIWVPSGSEDELLGCLGGVDGVQATIGRTAYGIEGFRTSHGEALAAQAVLIRLGSPRRVTRFADVELVDVLTRDREVADTFVTRTLGELAQADRTLRRTVLTYIQCGFNTTRGASRLYAHRNTVERRIARADALSATKLDDNPAQLAAALLILDLRDQEER